MPAMPPEGPKPAYLGLLNAISLAETNAGHHLRAWANATDDDDLACTLRFVAARETSHGEVFCRRIQELGYDLMPKDDPKAAEYLVRLANPKISDCEKIGPERAESEDDPFGEIDKALSQGKYDPMTTNLLTWYIAEERDSGHRLRKAYAGVRARMNGASKSNGEVASGHSAGPSADAQAIMACMADGFARLEKTMQKLAKSRA